jgi:hypothetical protein
VRGAQPDAVRRNVVKQYDDQAIRSFKNGGRRNGRKKDRSREAAMVKEAADSAAAARQSIAEAVRIIEVRVKEGLEEIRIPRRALLGRARLRHQDKS